MFTLILKLRKPVDFHRTGPAEELSLDSQEKNPAKRIRQPRFQSTVFA